MTHLNNKIPNVCQFELLNCFLNVARPDKYDTFNMTDTKLW